MMLRILLVALFIALSQQSFSPEGSGLEFQGLEEDSVHGHPHCQSSRGKPSDTDELLTNDIIEENGVCLGSLLTMETREMIVRTHNDLRSSLAKGNQANFNGTMMTARNMYKLTWDCSMERKIKKHIQFCNSSYMPGQTLKSDSQLYKTFWLHWDGWNHTQNIRRAMKHWWNEGKMRGNNDERNRYHSSKNFYAWANVVYFFDENFPFQMAKGKSTRMGCSYQICKKEKKAMFACLYNVKAQCENEMIYEPGNPCEEDEDCFTYPHSRCLQEEGLCLAPVREKDDGTGMICPNNTKMSDLVRQEALDLHNFYRSRLARGLEWNGETNTSQAPARNMLEMEYDCELEQYAQEWAENCVFAHSDFYSRPNQGQNLYMTSFLYSDPRSLLHTGIEKWWQELEEVGVPEDNILSGAMWAKKGKAVGHWTQMAWSRSFRLGCAVFNCPNMGYLVCHYGPAGNRKGSLIYEVGDPCTTDEECPRGFFCKRKEGLCALKKDSL